MATARKWSNISISMESARAAAKTITGITKANPAVVTAPAHGFSNGDRVILQSVGGMTPTGGFPSPEQ